LFEWTGRWTVEDVDICSLTALLSGRYNHHTTSHGRDVAHDAPCPGTAVAVVSPSLGTPTPLPTRAAAVVDGCGCHCWTTMPCHAMPCHAPRCHCQPRRVSQSSNAQAEVELDDPKVRIRLAAASRAPRHTRRKKPQSEHGMGREGKGRERKGREIGIREAAYMKPAVAAPSMRYTRRLKLICGGHPYICLFEAGLGRWQKTQARRCYHMR
jgi:hypothetical protein